MKALENISGLSADDVTNRLLVELAANLRPPTEIFSDFGYTAEDSQVLMASPGFGDRLREVASMWNSEENRDTRIRAKAAMVVEDGIPTLAAVLYDASMAIGSRLDAFKQLSKIAGAEVAQADNTGTGGGFRITMNFGFQDSPQVIEGRTTPVLQEN